MKNQKNPFASARLFLGLLATALLASTATSQAAIILGENPLTTYGYTDGLPAMILFNTDPLYAIPGSGTITSGSIYADSGAEGLGFAFVLLSPAGGNTYTVKNLANETVAATVGVQTFDLNWTVQSTDVLAYWGKGASYSETGSSSFYASVTSGGGFLYSAPEPALGNTYPFYATLTYGADYVKYGTRAYAVNYSFAVPEPSTYAMLLLGTGLFSLLRSRRA